MNVLNASFSIEEIRNGIASKYSFEEIQSLKNESIWTSLAALSIQDAFEEWIKTFGNIKNTRRSYTEAFNMLAKAGIIQPSLSLQAFSLLNHNLLLDSIKTKLTASEATKQARSATFISFVKFLNRITQGIIPRLEPNKSEAQKTFYKLREKIATEAMTRAQWTRFLQELANINKRDCLLAKVMLQGAKRLNEALTLTTDMINFTTRQIRFVQSKTRNLYKETVITYPQELIYELEQYIGHRKGIVFISSTKIAIYPNQILRNFVLAGQRAKVPFKVTPHVLRASAITYLKREGFSDSDICKVSGHSSYAMVNAYDKNDVAVNITQHVNLIT